MDTQRLVPEFKGASSHQMPYTNECITVLAHSSSMKNRTYASDLHHNEIKTNTAPKSQLSDFILYRNCLLYRTKSCHKQMVFEIHAIAFNATWKKYKWSFECKHLVQHFTLIYHTLYIPKLLTIVTHRIYTPAMLMSQIKHIISARSVSSAVSISTGFKPMTTIIHSFPTASSYSSVSKVWLKSGNILPLTATATAVKPVFLEAGKRFHSTITSSACKEINMISTVNNQEAKIESSISIPSTLAKNQEPIKSQSIKEENIEALNYVVIQMNSGRWNEEEKKKFKTKLMELSSCPPMGSKAFFLELAKAVGSRTVQQCKQHHGYHYRGMFDSYL